MSVLCNRLLIGIGIGNSVEDQENEKNKQNEVFNLMFRFFPIKTSKIYWTKNST